MEKKLVVKANKLNESRYRLSVQEQRIILKMLSMIDQGDMDFQPYRFSVKDFADLVGITGKNIYGRVKRLTRGLLSRGLTIKEDDGDLHIGWISSAKYFDGQGDVELRFDPLLKPYLLALKQEFTRYQLKNTIRLKSSYSVRIYELLKQYQAVGSRYFDVEELREIVGVPDDKLRPYSNFKLKVLEPAKRELTTTDIGFNYQPVKTGRRVTGLDFTIFSNREAVKASYKRKSKEQPKQDKPKIIETQPELDFKRSQAQQDIRRLDRLAELYPDQYAKLEKQAENRLSKAEKKKPGLNLTVRFKMASLLPGFIQKNKIEGI